MTNNFTKFKKIIDEFRGKVSDSNFETRFTAVSKNIPKKDRFLLKMELKRLAGPCVRLIDLRGHVDGECRPYEHDSRSHFLDDIAINVFKENIALYGKYTMGVYEAVMNTENNFRVIYQKEKQTATIAPSTKNVAQKPQEKTQYPVKLFPLVDYHNRVEERMNFSITLLISIGSDSIECNSSDISVHGCRFRLPTTKKVAVGQTLSIRFLGLEQEFEFGAADTFEYEVKNIQLMDNIQLVGVKSVVTGDSSLTAFQQFLFGFIQGNKRRYKVNLDNSISAIQARSYEQYALPKLNELPVFIGGEAEKFVPKYALICQNNKYTFQYWQDEKKSSTLQYLITPERVNKLKKAMSLGQGLLVYSFIHKSGGKHYFYSADEVQLKESSSIASAFLGFAANKPDFAITFLSLSMINKGKANVPYTLSDAITTKDNYLNLPISDEHVQKVDEIAYGVVVSDITDSALTNTYKELPYDNISPSQLKVFGHKPLKSPFYVEELGINYKNYRKEPRFQYKTSVEVMSQKIKWLAKSQNFSASGLRIEFAEAVPLNKGDIVYLSLPDLQKITTEFNLTELAYEVVRTDKHKTSVNLKVYVAKHKHIGKAFFKALIDKNKDKLTPDQYASMIPSLAKPLRNIYSNALTIPQLIVQASGSRYKVEVMVCGQESGNLLSVMRQLSHKKDYYNLYPVLSSLNANNALAVNLKKIHASDAPITDIVYVAIIPDSKTSENKVVAKLASELNTLKMQQFFIKNALKKGQFFCLQLKLSRTNAPDMNYLNPELSYIGSYAIHRGKQIEQDIWSVSGVIQVLDITQEALLRIQLASA